MKRNVSVVCVLQFLCNILIIGKIIKEMPGSVASGTPYIMYNVKAGIHVSTLLSHLQALVV